MWPNSRYIGWSNIRVDTRGQTVEWLCGFSPLLAFYSCIRHLQSSVGSRYEYFDFVWNNFNWVYKSLIYMFGIRFIRTYGSIYHFSYSNQSDYSLIGNIILLPPEVVLWLVTKILFPAEVVLCSESEYQRIRWTSLNCVSFWRILNACANKLFGCYTTWMFQLHGYVM